MKRDYGMTEVAKILGVARCTVIRWVKQGEFKGFQTQAGHNRITHESLAAYMEGHGIPLEYLSASRKPRVLIVDDDVDVLSLLQRALAHKRDMEFRFAGNGFEAGVFLKDFMPHVVVLDIQLPDIDGRKICEFIRAAPEHRRTRIIAISGVIRAAESKALLDCGFDAYLQKPFDVQVLVEEIKKRIIQPIPSARRGI